MLSLYEIVLAAHSGDEEGMLTLIEKFCPLLKKLARHLRYEYEDAYSDMLVAFIGLIRNKAIVEISSHDEGCIVSYIQKSMQHTYYRLAIKEDRRCETPLESPLEAFSSSYFENWDNLCFEIDILDWETFDYISSGLDKRKAEIIILILRDDTTTQELAARYGVSPSIISRSKHKALCTLRKMILNDLFFEGNNQ